MSTDYISLATLAKRMDIYERMPMRLREGLQHSIRITLITNLICIPLLAFQILPKIASWLGDLDFFSIMESISYTLIFWIWRLSEPLLILNVISLALILLVLVISSGMGKPVREPVHWLAWGAAVPSGISAVSLASLAVLFILLVAVTLLMWIIGICIAAIIFGAVLKVLAS